MIPTIIDAGSKVLSYLFPIIDRVFPDKTKAEQVKLEAIKMQQAGEFKQIDADLKRTELENNLLIEQSKTNQIEAQSNDAFKSGWRPAIGWVCALGFSYEFFFRPLLSALLAAHSVTFPVLDTSELMTLTFGMLGLAGIRSFDKLKKGK
jgi:hypothetical protein